MKTTLILIIFVALESISFGGMMTIVSPVQITTNELYITSTTDFAHTTEYQFCIKKERAKLLPKWSPTEELPLSPHEAAKIAIAWHKENYPKDQTARIHSISIQSINETDRSHWYFSFFIMTTDEADLQGLSNAVPIVIVLFDGTILKPKAIGSCVEYAPKPLQRDPINQAEQSGAGYLPQGVGSPDP